MTLGAERKHAFLGAACFLVASGPTKGGIEGILIERLLQRHGLHHVSVDRRGIVEWIDALGDTFFVGMDNEIEIEVARCLIAKLDHFAKLPLGIDVQHGKWQARRPEGLAGEMQEYG